MILNEYILIKLNSRNVKRLKGLGYNGKIGEEIKIRTDDLSKGSGTLILVKCDLCETEKTIQYIDYINGLKNLNFYSCVKCKNIKREKTCLEQYGSKNYNNTDKNKKTCLEKYGVENVFQNKEIKERIIETNLDKYGKKSFTQTNEYIIKTKRSKKDKYNDENYNNREKSKLTCLEKYGVDSFMKTDKFNDIKKNHTSIYKNEIKLKTNKTNKERYGFENVFQNKEIKEKIAKTNLKKYGVEYPAQNEEIFNKQQKTRFQRHEYKKTNLFYRGTYEKDFLDNYYDKIKIEKANPVKYIFNHKLRTYFPDFFLPDFNLVIEIKSNYIFELELEQNLLKQKACLENNNYLFIIDKNYLKLNQIIYGSNIIE
jgi:hypothetical protein